ncbi:class I SAM-dependent methyltransferase [Arenibaculum pallidiluteum]|uniref:class I SAM-dependent methyltransferase n=1 Tax=Arenibaculum pallidiluteum TaxID=2812559 RepID=UPI001A96879C|nr:methyltransferase domain-containing protein [Arenibaculum pallidiluteum]
MNDVLKGYEAAATPDLIDRYEAISPLQLYEPVLDLLPDAPSRVADIGAGTGRDAAWMASKGHVVVAVEPVRAFRRAGLALHGSTAIEWVDDSLPGLGKLSRHGRFDCVLLSAVWHHLDHARRPEAIQALAGLTAPGGLLVMSLRHGPATPDRRVFDAAPDETIGAARERGFSLVRRREAGSVQAANRSGGVRWTWLAFAMS